MTSWYDPFGHDDGGQDILHGISQTFGALPGWHSFHKWLLNSSGSCFAWIL